MSLLAASASIHRAYPFNIILSSLQTTRTGRQLFKFYWSAKSPSPHSRPFIQSSYNADITTQDCDIEKFYEYTSGRWLWKETSQFARRYVKFSLPGLRHVSAQAISARSSVEVLKLHEGNFNKVFEITVEDGRKLIAKIPNPNAGRPHFTTASEVATMDYVRNVLGIPAPRVYGWSSSTDNPVKAEYILMDRSEGVELTKVWDNITWAEKYNIVETLIRYEKAFVSAKLPMYGSLYYAKDLPNPSASQFLDSVTSIDNGEAFEVGPTTNRAWFDEGRDAVEVDRGPWPSINKFVLSRAARELACIDKFSSYPSQQGLFSGPHQYHPSKALKVRVLQEYRKVATQILPKDLNLAKPTLWHSDLHGDNIFVDPSNPTKIVNVIDWQAVNISPLFIQAHHPSIIEFEGAMPEGLKAPELPENFDDMSEEEQRQAKELRAAQSLYKLYEVDMMQKCPDIAKAMRFRNTLSGKITGMASSVFSDGEPILQGFLIRLQDEWATVVGADVPCPLSFTPEERELQQDSEKSWVGGVDLMHEVLTEIGVYQGWDGWVNHNNYEMYKERLARCREGFLERYGETEEERREWERVWPFQDKMDPQMTS